MADYLTTDTELTSVANAIRTKGGTSASLVYPTGFVTAINNIPAGGGANLQANKTVTPTSAQQIVLPDAYGSPTETIPVDTFIGNDGSNLIRLTCSTLPSETKYIQGEIELYNISSDGTSLSVIGLININGVHQGSNTIDDIITVEMLPAYSWITVSTSWYETPSGIVFDVMSTSVSALYVTQAITFTDLYDGLKQVTVEGIGQYAMFGPGAEYVGRVWEKVINLANDTDYDSWTASTTAHTLRAASTTAEGSYLFDVTDHDFWIICGAHTEVAFNSGATKKATVEDWGYRYITSLFGRPNSSSQIKTGTIGSSASVNFSFQTLCGYYSTSGTKTYAIASYGPMYCSSSPVLSIIPSGTNTTVNFRASAISCRCNSTYFATARKTEVDSANTNMTFWADVYRVPRAGSWMHKVYEDLRTSIVTA